MIMKRAMEKALSGDVNLSHAEFTATRPHSSSAIAFRFTLVPRSRGSRPPPLRGNFYFSEPDRPKVARVARPPAENGAGRTFGSAGAKTTFGSGQLGGTSWFPQTPKRGVCFGCELQRLRRTHIHALHAEASLRRFGAKEAITLSPGGLPPPCLCESARRDGRPTIASLPGVAADIERGCRLREFRRAHSDPIVFR
jgi:hypothetical protein